MITFLKTYSRLMKTLFVVTILSFFSFFSGSAYGAGLGSAGSLTFQGFIIGIVVLGVIFLVFLGLLLFSKANELAAIARSDKKGGVYSADKGEVMNLTEAEINSLLEDRHMKASS